MKSLSELLALPPADTHFLWDEVLPIGGLSIVAGRPKAGKSTFMRNSALSVARCGTCCDVKTVQGPVVFFALKDAENKLASRFRGLDATENDPIRFPNRPYEFSFRCLWPLSQSSLPIADSGRRVRTGLSSSSPQSRSTTARRRH